MAENESEFPITSVEQSNAGTIKVDRPSYFNMQYEVHPDGRSETNSGGLPELKLD